MNVMLTHGAICFIFLSTFFTFFLMFLQCLPTSGGISLSDGERTEVLELFLAWASALPNNSKGIRFTLFKSWFLEAMDQIANVRTSKKGKGRKAPGHESRRRRNLADNDDWGVSTVEEDDVSRKVGGFKNSSTGTEKRSKISSTATATASASASATNWTKVYNFNADDDDFSSDEEELALWDVQSDGTGPASEEDGGWGISGFFY